MTLAAVRALASCTTLFAAASAGNEDSIALSIAQPHLPPGTPTVLLKFPMTQDHATLRQAWQANAKLVRQAVEAGERCVFLTLGDPLLYSTFGYLLRTLLAQDPDFPVTVIPGITAFQAAAAHLRQPLAEGQEQLLIVPGVRGGAEVHAALTQAENLVILKAGKNYPAIHAALTAHGALERSHLATRLGLPGERVELTLPAPQGPLPYLSLILVEPAQRMAPQEET